MNRYQPCSFCGDQVDVTDDRHTYRRIIGWEKIAGTRASGKHGGSDIVLRERIDEWAHTACVTAARAGVVPGQEALL